jgi:PAS domain S-box-containing protein
VSSGAQKVQREYQEMKDRKLNSRFHTVVLVCLVAALSYLAPKLASALWSHPQTVWPFWPGCALLVSVLLLVPRSIWPIVVPAAFAGFAFFDVQAGVSTSSIIWFILADTVQVLTAALCLSYFFDGVPQLNSVKAVSKYAFSAVLLAPSAAAFISAVGIRGDYWNSWSISFFSEVLAFATITPAILSWVSKRPAWARRSRTYYLEFAALIAGLVILGFITFTRSESSSEPALLYSLVPFLLWAALRFGSRGISNAMLVVSLLSIWGVVHGRGPFVNGGPLSSMLALQLFLIFAVVSFMVLAALVEERKSGGEALREGEERLRLAMEAGKLGVWEWDIKSRRNLWFGEAQALLGMTPAARSGSVQDFWDRVHPDHLGQLRMAIDTAKQNHTEFDQEFRVVWTDGAQRWLRSQGKFFYAPDGEPTRLLGISRDITERKQVEQALLQNEAELMEAQRLANVGSWWWDSKTDTVKWSEELYRIAGIDPSMPAVSFKDHSKLYTAESWERLRAVVEEALRTGTPYELDLEMIRSDSARRWLVARGEAHRDASGEVVHLRGTVHDITERKRAEHALRESEERLQLAVRAGRMYAFEWDMLTDVIVRPGECVDIFNWMDDPTCVTGRQLVERIHPEDREAYAVLRARLTPEQPNYKTSYRVLRPDRSVIWLEVNGYVFFDEQGRMLRIIGIMADITERKFAEEVLSSVSRRLIEAQEEERTWIARELHDDINQRIALLANQLEQWAQHPSKSVVEATDHIRRVCQDVSKLGTDIQALSHRLHSSKLEYLGLAAAARSFCEESSEQQKVEIEFSHAGIPRSLPKEISLCLFRVLQEALQNAVKHSGERHFRVELNGTSRGIQLTVNDLGVGFDEQDAMSRRGLGLISMRERMQLVGGAFSIESKPGSGTTIRAWAPFIAEEHRASAAG